MLFFKAARLAPVAIVLALLSACGGDEDSPAAPRVTAEAPIAGPTPFIALVKLDGDAIAGAASVRFQIAPKPGSVSKPVSVTYSVDYLGRHGRVTTSPAGLTVPVFGLYAGRDNQVTLQVRFASGQAVDVPVTITTAAWVDPHAVYDHPTIVQARSANAALGFDFLYMKSVYGSPVVIDTDGEVRWVGPAGAVPSASLDYDNGGFVIGSSGAGDIYRMEFDGSYGITGSLATTGVTAFAHDIEAGKTGLIGNVDGNIAGVFQLESTAQEFKADGSTIAFWDMAKAVSDVMTAGGDDPALFVRPGADWFHMNTAIYDAADDSVIISSRENFIVKVDYQTGAIRWIIGDPTKYWYTFPSLRGKALTWVGDALVPIGQHSISLLPDGSLMLFNNGHESANQPAGTPTGQSRAYSAVSDYVIDEAAGTVREAWRFDHGQTILSIVCSSARQSANGSLLIDYAVAENLTATRIVGTDPSHAVVFDFRYPTTGCNTAWNSQILPLEALEID